MSSQSTFLTYEEALERLTPREIEVMKLVRKHLTNKEIAEELHLSVRTVQTHRHTICKKCSLKGRHALIKWLWKTKTDKT